MKFPFPFKATEIATTTTTTSAAPSWPWPSCATAPKTLSFRAAATTTNNIYKTINSAYDLDDINTTEFASQHFHEEIPPFESETQNDAVESAVIGALMSDRLFYDFEPGETNSILEEAKTNENENENQFSYKTNVAIVEVDTTDPFLEFRVSMEEMVEAHKYNDGNKEKEWEFLEGLLECYLRVNDRYNYVYIIGAFVDLLVRLDLVSASNNIDDGKCVSSSTQYSFTSPLSFSSSSSSSTTACNSYEDKVVVEKNGDSSSSSTLSYEDVVFHEVEKEEDFTLN